jgi:phosphate transport system substrate-binding protein
VTAAGSSFAAPLFKQWIEVYGPGQPHLALSYDSVGSGEGIDRFLAGTLDIGATDAPMSPAEAARVGGPYAQVPVTAGMIAIAYNLPGVEGALNLPRDLYPDIFLGRIDRWDDPRIAAANPGTKLPAKLIQVVARLDSSGTTFALTNHLSAISDGWRNTHGAANRIDWPGGTMLMRGNEGVAGRVLQTEYALGYAEFGFAQRLGLQTAELQNAAGAFVAPSRVSGEAALVASADEMPENLRLFIADPKGADAYPIATFSWLLLYGGYADEGTRSALAEFVRYGLTDGQVIAAELGYVPLPAAVAERALAAVTGLS